MRVQLVKHIRKGRNVLDAKYRKQLIYAPIHDRHTL